MIPLMSRFGRQVNENHVLPDYPRPNLVRNSYFSLNGKWKYAISKDEKAHFNEDEILVPFSPEAPLSGVGKIVQPNEYLHYLKQFDLPEIFRNNGRILLHFEAVDQECRVYLNGSEIGSHEGGYLAFSFDVTETIKLTGNELRLLVKDATEKAPYGRGKQKLVKKGKYGSLFYTPQSGIWKSVWLESVAPSYVEKVRFTPYIDSDEIGIHIFTKGNETRQEAQVQIFAKETLVCEKMLVPGKEERVALPDPVLWTTENPFLYDVRITYGDDVVTSYFGMRSFTVEKDSGGVLRFCLNHKPVFFNGVLDQGYWPEGLLTAPSEDALLYDITTLKELGYNTIRKHIKVESERFYYLCDKLGMFVWQDMPCGGGEYNMVFVTYLPNMFPWFGRIIKDRHYKLFARENAEGRAQYQRELSQMVEQLYNHPSIAAWVPFNEGWGQFDARKATALIREKDGTRLVNEACGWFDQQGGDMYSIHNYVRKLKVKPRKDRPVALTEYGGYAYPVPGHMACEKEFGYQHYKSKEELTQNYKRLWEEEIFPNLECGLCSAIYTQTSDIEEEINGLMTYDREELKMKKEVVLELNNRLYKRFREITK